MQTFFTLVIPSTNKNCKTQTQKVGNNMIMHHIQHITHYGKQRLPLVSNALGEGPVALGEAFSECNTRGRGPEVSLHGKGVFPESRKLCTRGRLSREPSSTQGIVDAVGEQTEPFPSLFFLKFFFPECNTQGKNPLPRAPQPRHSGKEPSSPSAAAQALGEAYFLIFFKKSFAQLKSIHAH